MLFPVAGAAGRAVDVQRQRTGRLGAGEHDLVPGAVVVAARGRDDGDVGRADPATTLPSERSETPKSLAAPRDLGVDQPRAVPPLGAGADALGRLEPELDREVVRRSGGRRCVVVDPSNGRRGVGVPGDRSGRAERRPVEVVAVVGAPCRPAAG